ncbi:MAG: aldo/keto reductase [Bacteroidales bacterium]|nr:aldo/keto reductase [Bacteroidales bacterium]
MNQIILSEKLTVSRIALGFWRVKNWNFTTNQLLNYIESALDKGITTFDHADIYGDFQAETIFGNALKQKPSLREKMQLVTKCGIQPLYRDIPGKRVKFYDTSFQHIVKSVDQSLKNFNTDYIDLLLIHRADPLMNPEETARAFDALKQAGKVLHFGVSNFSFMEFEMLNRYTSEPLITNQVEISPYTLEHFENSNMAFFLKEKIHPMAWSPLAGGKLINPVDEKSKRINEALMDLANRLNIPSIDTLVYAWLLHHPAGIIPIIGSGKIERMNSALAAFDINLTTEMWYEIYEASLGQPVP